MPNSTTPILLLVFANDEAGSLRHLQEEHEELRAIFKRAAEEGRCQVISFYAATPSKIIETFLEHRGRVRLFHYGGHSDADELFWHKDYFEQLGVQAKTLARFLATQPGLELVFLNGCLNLAQAEGYHEAGVRTIVATDQPIGDQAARVFAQLFYQSLVGRATIAEAFQSASAGFELKHGDLWRGILNIKPAAETLLPWQLFPKDGHQWRLPLATRQLTTIPSINLEKEFIGREQDLKSLAGMFNSSAQNILIRGLGGIGKTVLATAYANTYSGDYDNLVWINGGDDFVSSIALNLELGHNLDLPLKEEMEYTDRFHQICWKLQQIPGRNLLVIDNVQEQIARKEIYEALTGLSNWQILITSRLHIDGFDHLHLPTLQPDDARSLFRTYYPGNYSDQELEPLLQEIGYHTLTVELLAKLLEKSDKYLSLSKLLEILQNKELEEVGFQEAIWTRHSKDEQTIYLHLFQAFKLSNLTDWDLWLLKQLAVLPSERYETRVLERVLHYGLDYRIMRDRFSKKKWKGKFPLLLQRVLRQLFGELVSRIFLRKIRLSGEVDSMVRFSTLNTQLLSLTGKGWLTRHEDGHFSIHRLIQMVVKSHLQIGYKDLEALCAALGDRLINHHHQNPVKDNDPWIPHAEALSNFLKDEKGNHMLNFLRKKLALRLMTHGQYVKAQGLLELNLRTGDRLEKKHNLSTLGQVYQHLGEYQKALKIIDGVYREDLKKFGITNTLTALSQARLAMVHHALKDYSKALALQKEALEIIQRRFDGDHHFVINIKSDLANIYYDLGRYDKALALWKEVLQRRLKLYVVKHPAIVAAQANKASVHYHLKEYKEAIDLLQQALQTTVEDYGPDHSATTEIRYFLGEVYLGNHQPGPASKCFEGVLKARLKHFGPKHSAVALIRRSLAEALLELSKPDVAKKQIEQAIAIHIATRGPDAPETIVDQEILYKVMEELKKKSG